MYLRFTVGDTFSLTSNLTAYPASEGWVLRHRIVPRDGSATPITIVCTADGDAHLAIVAAGTTANWSAGTYAFASYVTGTGGDVTTVDSGTIELLPDPRQATTLDTRSDAQIALQNVRAMLQGVATKNVQRYTINGRELLHYTIPDLIKLEAKLVTDVKREQQLAAVPAGNVSRRKIFARVGRG